jgi:hypothetical protein
MSHSGCSFLAVFSFSDCQILSGQSYPACPVIPVLFCLSCSAYPVLRIPLCLSYFSCPLLPVLFKILVFPPAKRLWALKLDLNCGGRKKSEFALFFFRARHFRFFSRFFFFAFALFFWLRARERKSAKKAPGPTSEK